MYTNILEMKMNKNIYKIESNITVYLQWTVIDQDILSFVTICSMTNINISL